MTQALFYILELVAIVFMLRVAISLLTEDGNDDDR